MFKTFVYAAVSLAFAAAGAVSLIEHRAGKLAYFDQIDSDKDGVVTVAEMKAAGVIK